MSVAWAAAAAAGIAGSALIGRQASGRRWEERIRFRLPRNPDGTIVGAEAITRTGGDCAVLLLHGFGDTPQSLAELSAFLHACGWTVRVPLLPGHGRSLREFARSGADDWIGCATNEYDALLERHSTVAVVGQSMGGAMAMLLAAQRREVSALVLLAPYFTLMPKVARIARYHRLVSVFMAYVQGRAEGSIRDPDERAKSLGYGVTSPRLLNELSRVARRAREAAPAVRAPTLMIQSRADNRISMADAEASFARLGGRPRELHWTDGNAHVISVDYGRQVVFERTASWLDRFGRQTFARSPT